MTNDLTESAEQLYDFIEELISKENDTKKRYALLAARDHMTRAIRCLIIDDLDRAEPYLEKAYSCIKEARA